MPISHCWRELRKPEVAPTLGEKYVPVVEEDVEGRLALGHEAIDLDVGCSSKR
jgi:hypothetical protein